MSKRKNPFDGQLPVRQHARMMTVHDVVDLLDEPSRIVSAPQRVQSSSTVRLDYDDQPEDEVVDTTNTWNSWYETILLPSLAKASANVGVFERCWKGCPPGEERERRRREMDDAQKRELSLLYQVDENERVMELRRAFFYALGRMGSIEDQIRIEEDTMRVCARRR